MAIWKEFNWAVTIEVGRHNIAATSSSDTIYSASYRIANAIIHKSYNEENNANDIGLVKSASYIRYNQGVGPACLPFSYKNFMVKTGTVMTTIGFGSTEFGMSARIDKKSWTLQKVLLTVNSSLPLCKNDGNKICAKGAYNSVTKQYKDSCQRDSGGALLGIINNRYFAFGINS